MATSFINFMYLVKQRSGIVPIYIYANACTTHL